MLYRADRSRVVREYPTVPLEYCIAKTWREKGKLCLGRTVFEHSRITEEVARVLLSVLLPVVYSILPLYAEKAVALHDIGKISPQFVKKIYASVGFFLPALSTVNIEDERLWGGHASVSYASIRAALPEKRGLAAVVGWHHGYPPHDLYEASFEKFGGRAWQAKREEFIQRINKDGLFPNIASKEQELLLKGFVSLCDWIGSGELFDDPSKDWRGLVPEAVKAAGFSRIKLKKGLGFQEIFGFAPNVLQERMIEASKYGQAVYVVESPMGNGKTEAALYLAYRMLEQGLASGVYFALPTRLSSKRIYERFCAFLKKIEIERGILPVLCHGNAKMSPWGRADEEDAPLWSSLGRRALLAPFAVGTIQQALLSVLFVRYASIRAFGLAGKVVILDEVHSYDEAIGTHMDSLIQLLRKVGCTVILLSATLSKTRRERLLRHPVHANDYSLITVLTEEGCYEVACDDMPAPLLEDGYGSFIAMPNPFFLPEPYTVFFMEEREEEEAVQEARRRAEEGQQVLWIENTVSKAQEIYRRLSAIAKVECGLLHSRFTAIDRCKKEKYWVTAFSSFGRNARKKGRILIGTQVLEQSLNLDADFLVSRFCPIDMLLQRLGRLWRKEHRFPRCSSARKEAWFLCPPVDYALEKPEEAFGTSGKIYAPYILARSLEFLAAKVRKIVPLLDVRSCMEAVYTEREETEPGLQGAKRALEQRREKIRSLALSTESTNGRLLDESWVLHEKTIDVLVLKACYPEQGLLSLADGGSLCVSPERSTAQERNTVISRLAESSIQLPEAFLERKAFLSCDLKTLLAPYLSIKNLRVVFLQENGKLVDWREESINAQYSQEYGWEQDIV